MTDSLLTAAKLREAFAFQPEKVLGQRLSDRKRMLIEDLFPETPNQL